MARNALMSRSEPPPAMDIPPPAAIPAQAMPVPDDLPDTEMLVALIQAMARKGQQQPEMLPTLTGIENQPRQPELARGIDYSQPQTGGNALIGRLPTATFDTSPEGEAAATRGLQELSYPAGGRSLSPSMQERADQAESGRTAAGLLTAGSAFVPVEAAGVRGLQMAGNVAARYPAATTAAAGTAALAAAPGEAEPPSELSRARDAVQKSRERQATIEADQRRLRDEAKQYDNINLRDAEAVRRAQAAVGTKPDGIWSDKTAAAVQAYRDRKNKEADSLDARLSAIKSDIDRQDRAVTDAEGGERLRVAEQNVPPFNAFLRNYGEYVGTGLGLGIGAAGRIGMVRHANQSAAESAHAIEEMLARQTSSVPQRTGRMNEVWRRGGANSDRVPFTSAPGSQYGVDVNANTLPSSELFRGPTGIRGQFTGSDIAATAGAGGEIAISEARRRAAEDELARAREDAQSNPSELNISRIQRALDEVAFWQGMSRMGQTAGAGYILTATKTPRSYPRPNLQEADAETARLNRLIRPQQQDLPAIEVRRRDTGYRLPEGAPVARGEVETWVSPSGRDVITRDHNGVWHQQGQTGTVKPPQERKGWRRIAEASGNALLG